MTGFKRCKLRKMATLMERFLLEKRVICLARRHQESFWFCRNVAFVENQQLLEINRVWLKWYQKWNSKLKSEDYICSFWTWHNAIKCLITRLYSRERNLKNVWLKKRHKKLFMSSLKSENFPPNIPFIWLAKRKSFLKNILHPNRNNKFQNWSKSFDKNLPPIKFKSWPLKIRKLKVFA